MPNNSSTKVVGKTFPLMSEKQFDKFCQDRIKRLKTGELKDTAYEK